MTEFTVHVLKITERVDGAKSPVDGHYVIEYDPSRDGDENSMADEIQIVTTPNWRDAKRFDTQEEATAYWQQVNERQPERPWDGKPNRPLTAFSTEVQAIRLEETQRFKQPTEGTRGLLIHPNGEFEFRGIRDYHDMNDAVGSDNMDWTAPGPVTYYCYGYALYERPLNPVATILYRGTHDTTDPLAGPVLVLGPPKDENDTDVPNWFVEQAAEVRDRLGQEEIDRMAVPLSDADQEMFRASIAKAQKQASEQLKRGGRVDFGGIILGREPAEPPPEVVEGQHRKDLGLDF